MSEDQIKWLKENIRLDISIQDHYTYNGEGSQMYTSYKTIKLYLADECIQEVSFE